MSVTAASARWVGLSLSLSLSLAAGCGARSSLIGGEGAYSASGGGGDGTGGEGATGPGVGAGQPGDCPGTLGQPFLSVGPNAVSPKGQFVDVRPAVAMGDDGQYVIAWTQQSSFTAAFQRYDATGAPLGEPIQASPPDMEVVFRKPSVAMDANGGFVVAWLREDDFAVELQRYDGEGQPIGPIVQVTEPGHFVESPPAIALAPGGLLVVAWAAQAGNDGGLFFRMYSTTGLPLGGAIPVGPTTDAFVVVEPALAMSATGDFVIAWRQFEGQGVPIRAQRYAVTGAPLGGVIEVNEGVPSGISIPAAAMAADGRFVIAWLGEQTGNHVLARVFEASGEAVGPALQVDEENESEGSAWGAEVYDPDPPTQSVSMASNGDFVVSWNASHHGPYFRRFDASGDPLSPELPAAPTQQYAAFPAITAVSRCTGNHVVAWTETADLFQVRHTLHLGE